MRILYVGDTACLPDDLADYIGDMGDEWTVEVVADAKSAMYTVANGPVDVVMARPALADLPPATLLCQIRTLHVTDPSITFSRMCFANTMTAAV